MTLQGLRNPLRQAFASKARLPSWTVVQALALVAAGALAYNGARILNQSPRTVTPNLQNFDGAMPWLGLALLAILVVAWEPRRPKLSPRSWFAALPGFWRTHWVEVLLFALIFAFGIFMRVYRFGDTLPPADGLCCEEHINGGVAYHALQGERPLLFPLVRWASAAGFLLFGENTLGLRFFFPVMGIATLIPFYFLLRQLVRVPAALFGLALFAAAWWPSLRSRQTAEGTIYAVVFAFLLVRGLKTKSPLMFLGAGIVAGLISYEYEAFRIVPIIAAGFVVAAALREVLLRGRPQLAIARQRAYALLTVAWRPALVFLMAAGIVLVPMIIGTRHGHDLYLTGVHRQEGSRDSLLADKWQEQVKWATEIFLPFGAREYPTSPPRDIPETPLLDPLAAWLALAGLLTGAVFFFRGFRLLFVGWFLVSLAAGGLLLRNFSPFTFLGLVPIALVLAALFVDDARTVVARAFGPPGTRVLGGLLVIGAGFSLWWNADTLFNDLGPSPRVQRHYGGELGLIYGLCDYLQERGADNHTFAFSTAQSVRGFATPREQEGRAWGDFIWVCRDLQGTALPAAEEAWPLRHVPAGITTLAFANPFGPVDELIEELNRAYPGLGEPDRRILGPGDTYTIVSYEFDSGEELAQRGLWADYVPAGGDGPAVSRVDPIDDLLWEREGLPLAPPFTVRWRGVVYVEERVNSSLRAVTEEPAEVRLDGQIVYDTRSGEREEIFIDLLPGWHPVEITLDKQHDGGAVRLIWAQPSGDQQAVQPEDLFPLAELKGWLHQRSLGLPGDRKQLVTQRFDFVPHYASTAALKLQAKRGEPFVTEERWHGVWEVGEPGNYLLRVEFMAGSVTLLVDGEPVATGAMSGQRQGELEVEVALGQGRHTLELVQQLERDTPWSGVTLSVKGGASGEAPGPDAMSQQVVPY